MTTESSTLLAEPKSPRRVLEGQTRILELLGTDRSTEEVLADVCRLLEEHLPGTHCAISLYDPIGGVLRATGSGSLTEAAAAAIAEQTPAPTGSPGARAFDTASPVHITDLEQDDLWDQAERAPLLEAGIQGCWSTPLEAAEVPAEGKALPLGTVDFFLTTDLAPDSEDWQLLEAGAELARYVVLRARMLAGLLKQSQFDTMTGLPNRAHFSKRLRDLVERCREDGAGSRFAIVAIDIDQLKNINDTLGFNMGDYLLRAIGQRLVACVRRDDTVARASGDEFLLILKDIQRNDDVALIAEKIRSRINAPYDFDGQGLFVTATIGISVFPWDGEDPQTLLRNAETALAHAKDLGGSAYQLFRPTMVRNKPTFEDWWQRSKLSNDLRDALEKDQFELYYQLQFDNRGQSPLGSEALIRWHHPELGMLLPNRFIPMAEQTGLIVEIGAWALETACRQNKQWQDSGLASIPVSVNVTAHQFRHGNLRETVIETLERTGLAPEHLELEITESLAMEDGHNSLARLQALKDVGIKLTIDDFGTGFSSLSYLNRFPIDTLKIDQSFIRDIGTNNENDVDSRSIVRAILSVAESLDLEVVAEGVETDAQLTFLRENGCDIIQGFLLARPRDSDVVTKTLIKRS